MDTYNYQAALWCEDCARRVIHELRRDGVTDNGDSDTFPQGPYACGGGEADSPQHCDNCGMFLENALTPDGADYVRDALAPYDADTWEKVARRAEAAGNHVAAEWARFYFAPGQ